MKRMRNYIYYISFLLLASLCMVSCTEQQIEGLDEGKYIQIKTNCVNLNATRAEGDPTIMGGEESLNENLIKTIHYFLYPDNQTGNNAVMAGKVNVEQNSSADLRIQIDEDILNNLFPSYNQYCEVYLIANLPSDINIDLTGRTNTSLEELKQKSIVAFKNNKTEIDSKEYYSSEKQESFVMTGQGKAELKSRKKALAVSGQVNLDRLASKYTISVNASQFTDDNNHKWTPEMGTLQLYVNNVVSNTTLAGTIGTERFNYRYDANANDPAAEDIIPPFYSYPCQWQAHEDNALSMNIILYWQEYDAYDNTIGQPRPCYYKVFPNVAQLAPNCWYNMNLEIGVLGSFEPEDAKILTNTTCEVVPWNNGNTDWAMAGGINANILNARYLIVEQNEYILNNKNTFEIPFSSSHEVIIKGYDANTDDNTANAFKVTKKIFIDGSTPVNKDYNVTTDAKTGNWITIKDNKIVLNHPLNNNFESTTDYDYTPYTFTFTICHKDNQNNFQEKITIIQKPAISVTAELNTKFVQNSNSNDGYVFVNANSFPNYGSTNNSYNYGGLGNLQASGNNSNPYMYIIEVSVLPKGSEYILGDPRARFTWSQSDINEFAQAPALNGTSPRKLTNYYGTINKSSVANMLAPKFRIASAHGRVASSFQNYNGIVKRSATYQEDGYPAGRWRLPTRAEIKFVTKLYADKKIPPLFHSTSGMKVAYWYSTGTVTPNSNGTLDFNDNPTDETTGAVRSVYDEWYWEQSTPSRLTDYTKFTWGDEIN